MKKNTISTQRGSCANTHTNTIALSCSHTLLLGARSTYNFISQIIIKSKEEKLRTQFSLTKIIKKCFFLFFYFPWMLLLFDSYTHSHAHTKIKYTHTQVAAVIIATSFSQMLHYKRNENEHSEQQQQQKRKNNTQHTIFVSNESEYILKLK
jgi:hypothetical protein